MCRKWRSSECQLAPRFNNSRFKVLIIRTSRLGDQVGSCPWLNCLEFHVEKQKLWRHLFPSTFWPWNEKKKQQTNWLINRDKPHNYTESIIHIINQLVDKSHTYTYKYWITYWSSRIMQFASLRVLNFEPIAKPQSSWTLQLRIRCHGFHRSSLRTGLVQFWLNSIVDTSSLWLSMLI